jgi:hypothetical protein
MTQPVRGMDGRFPNGKVRVKAASPDVGIEPELGCMFSIKHLNTSENKERSANTVWRWATNQGRCIVEWFRRKKAERETCVGLGRELRFGF